MGFVDRSRIPKVTPVALTTADIEYSHTFRFDTVAFEVKNRAAAVLRYSWATGGVASGAADGIYMSLPSGGVYSRDNVKLEDPHRTIYLASDAGGEYAEVEEWTR